MSATEDILEEALDVGEEIMDALEASSQLSAKHLVIVGALAGAISAVGAHIVTKKLLETKYDKMLEEQVAEAKKFYSRLNKKEEYDTPAKAAEELRKNDPSDIVVKKAADAITKYQGANDDEEAEEDDEEAEEEVAEKEEGEVNVFIQSSADETFDIQEEMKSRTPDEPYVISDEEFGLNEGDFSQTTITYYAGDGTLADERDQEIPLIDPIVGEENLDRFGHGSGDVRVVYIRNERLSSDFEVLKSDGKYSHEVLGFQHSQGSARERRRESELKRFRGGEHD